MTRVLVTGGAGFIGSNFVHYVLRHRPSWQVTVVDLLTYAGNLANLDLPLQQGKVDFRRSDIADAGEMGELFAGKKFDLVVHFAAESHVDRSIFSATEFVRTNVLGTQALLDAARSIPHVRFMHVSTDEVYGSLGPTGKFSELTPLDPTSPYAASKAASDLMVLAAAKTHTMDAIVTRCTNNFGPYQFPEKLIPLFVTNALTDIPLPLYGDGMNVRSWLFVEDHCEALCLIAEKGRRGEVYNIGGSDAHELPNVEVTKRILKILGKPETLVQRVGDRPAHDRRYAIDYSKIKQELGWEPRTSFDAGLESTIAWYKAHPSWWQTIKSGEYREFYEKNYRRR